MSIARLIKEWPEKALLINHYKSENHEYNYYFNSHLCVLYSCNPPRAEQRVVPRRVPTWTALYCWGSADGPYTVS